MGLFDFLKPKEKLDPSLLEALNGKGFDGDVNEDGTFCLTAPDGVEYSAFLREKELTVRFKQPQPYKVLFSFKKDGHYVNDPNPEGYRMLIDSLKASRSTSGVQAAVYTFLLDRYK